ncbi:MAG TPA: hypothetical protein VKY90_06930 [Candidatus Dormibacteraeota bacterium]|nr:hypothetical protein [Candidatus Dormibacteraeota bacterium]
MVTGLQSALATAQRTGLRTDPAPQALAWGRAFLALQHPHQLEQHDAVVAAVRAAPATIQHRLDARVRADQLLGRPPGLLDQATSLWVTGDVVARADVQAAEREQDDVHMDQAVVELQQAFDGLAGAVDRAVSWAAASPKHPTGSSSCTWPASAWSPTTTDLPFWPLR